MKHLNAEHYAYIEQLLAPEDVHVEQLSNPASEQMGAFIVLALFMCAIHGLLTGLLLLEYIPAVLFMIVHIIVSGIVLLVSYRQFKAERDATFTLILAVTCAVMGIFGAVGSLMSAVSYILFRQKAMSFYDWLKTIFPPDDNSHSEQVYDDIIFGVDENPRSYSVMPFLEVMQVGSEVQKRRALSRMTMHFHPRLAPAFKAALKDKNNTIRVQAATAVAKLENQFMEMLQNIREASVLAPHDPKVTFATARFYDDYAYTGLLDNEREKRNREQAITFYKKYLEHDADHIESWTAIGRLHFRAKQYAESAEWLRHALDRGWHSKNIIAWYFECLYKLNDFKLLREAVATYGRFINAREDLPLGLANAIELWMNHGSAPAAPKPSEPQGATA